MTYCKKLLDVHKNTPTVEESGSWKELVKEFSGVDPRICPNCGKGRMIKKHTIGHEAHAPPPGIKIAA